jgi:hypothetical protein
VFAVAGVSLLERARSATGPPRTLLLIAAGLSLAAMSITHHVTSWLTLLFLLAWFCLERGPGRRAIGIGLAAAVGSGGLWVALNARRLYGYFAPLVRDLLTQIVGAATGHQQRAVFSDNGGYRTPQWEQVVLIGYAGTVTAAALWVGLVGLHRLRRPRLRAGALLPLLSLLAPITFASRVLPSAGQFGDRAATFVFLPLSITVAALLTRVVSGRRASPAMRIGLAAVLTTTFIGGVLLGAGPNWERLPGPYLVAAENRSMDPETLAAVTWSRQNLPPGTTIVSDRITAALLSSVARLYPRSDLQPDADPASLYFATRWTAAETKTIRSLGAGYLYVDARWSQASPHVGVYLHEGESGPAAADRLSQTQLAKFAAVPGISVAYHRGPITLYDLAGIAGAQPRIQGWTGHRHAPGLPLQLGVGALLGAAAALLMRGPRGRCARAAGRALIGSGGAPAAAVTILATGCLISTALLLAGISVTPLAAMATLAPAAITAAAGLRHPDVRERVRDQVRDRLDRLRTGLRRSGLPPLIACAVAATVVAAAWALAVSSAYRADVLAVQQILR